MSERDTESLIERKLDAGGYIDIGKQESKRAGEQSLLVSAGKAGRGGIGKPEFVAHIAGRDDVVVVVECKASPTQHGGGASRHDATTSDPVGKAVDGVLHYAKALSASYDVIAVAASGETDAALVQSFFLWRKGADEADPLMNARQEYLADLPSAADLAGLIDSRLNPAVEKKRLMKVARDLHEFMRNYGALRSEVKPLIVAGTLIALRSPSFRSNYERRDAQDGTSNAAPRLGGAWASAIEDVLLESGVPQDKTARVVSVFQSVVDQSSTLGQRGFPIKRGSKRVTEMRSVLCSIITELDGGVFESLTHTQGYDLVGEFYGEFLKYATGDGKDLGIVLTPPQVTQLFPLLANVDHNSVVLDPCAGTGGFLVAAMEHMSTRRGEVALTQAQIERIKKKGLVGVEFQSNMYALSASNMLLRGDGRANLFLGSCFEPEIAAMLRTGDRGGNDPMPRPNVGFINPPYSQGKKAPELCEASFILHLLDTIEPGGQVFAIVPMSTATSTTKVPGTDQTYREAILARHTLEASMTMPPELFYGVGTQTVVLAFTAGRPQAQHHQTWFARWTDDGHVTMRGRKDLHNKWEGIRSGWVADFLSRRSDTPGYCVRKAVTADDEWLVEAYIEPDYSKLTTEDFTKVLREFAVYQMNKGAIGAADEEATA